jgi:hypothetical protein
MSGKVSDNIGRGSGSITEPSGGIEILSSDPTLTEGLVWYNSTSNVLKVARTATAWSAGGSLSVDMDLAAGCGTQGAAMGCGPNTDTDGTQLYNGSAWSASGNMNTGRYWLSCFGTQTAGVSCGGWDGGLGDTTEEFNGASWASGMEDLATARYNGASAGTQTAGLYFGGSNST